MSPAVLQKAVYAGTNATSFRQASEDLQEEAEMAISEQRIMRATKRIGEERIAQRDSEIESWEQLSLPEQQRSPRSRRRPLPWPRWMAGGCRFASASLRRKMKSTAAIGER